MTIAYAAAIINLQTGQVRYQIYTEWPVTRYRDEAEVHALIAEAKGRDFESAYRSLLHHMDVAKLTQAGLLANPLSSAPRRLHT